MDRIRTRQHPEAKLRVHRPDEIPSDNPPMRRFDNPRADPVWQAILLERPQNDDDHDPDCPGISDLLEASRESCPACRRWLADLLREDRRAEAEERKPRA